MDSCGGLDPVPKGMGKWQGITQHWASTHLCFEILKVFLYYG